MFRLQPRRGWGLISTMVNIILSQRSQVDYAGLRTMNATNSSDLEKIIKPYEHRFDLDTFIESDADEQLILFIPFVSLVKLKSISILGYGDDTNPTDMQAFINRDDIDFDNVASINPVQCWELVPNPPQLECPEYATRLTNFTNVRNITLFFPSNGLSRL